MDRELALRGADFAYVDEINQKAPNAVTNYAAKVTEKMRKFFADPFLAFVEAVVKIKGLDKKEEAPRVEVKREIVQPVTKTEEPFSIGNGVIEIDGKKIATNNISAKTAVLKQGFLSGLENVKNRIIRNIKKEEPVVEPVVTETVAQIENSDAVQAPEEQVEENTVTLDKPAEITNIDNSFFQNLPVGTPEVKEQSAPVELVAQAPEMEKVPETNVVSLDSYRNAKAPMEAFSSVSVGTPDTKNQHVTVDDILSQVSGMASRLEEVTKKLHSAMDQNATLKTQLEEANTRANNAELSGRKAAIEANNLRIANKQKDLRIADLEAKLSEKDVSTTRLIEETNARADERVAAVEVKLAEKDAATAKLIEETNARADERIAASEASMNEKLNKLAVGINRVFGSDEPTAVVQEETRAKMAA